MAVYYFVRSPKAGRDRLLFLLLLLLVSVPFDEGASTLFPGQFLSGDQTIVSKGEVFELGFFRPGKSRRFYVGIWYKNLMPQTVAWVANREAPISDSSTCQFKISDDGAHLVLQVSSSKQIVWSAPSSNISSKDTKTSSFAVLQDTGNLVLQNSKREDASIIWQSFDHPTDTWLPGAWLGRNNTSGEIQKLVSWKSYDDPAPGRFSYALQPGNSTEYFLSWNRTQNYWTTGRWNGRWFVDIPAMAQGARFNNFSFVNNERWTSFYYVNVANRTSRQVLDSATGQLQQFHWMQNSGQWGLVFFNPKRKCQVYALCSSFGVCVEDVHSCLCLEGFEPASPSAWGARDWSYGCARRAPLRCGAINSNATGAADFAGIKQDKFRALPYMRLPANPRRISGSNLIGDEDCELACLKYHIGNTSSDCSCTAYSFDNRVCLIWVGDLLNLQKLTDGDTEGRTLHLRIRDEEMLNKSKNRAINKVVVFVCSAAAGIVLLLVLGILCLYSNRKDHKAPKFLGDSSLILFPYRHLQSATKNFSEKLGTGGFGPVFRGVLPDTTAVAVKKLAHLQQGEKQFRAEVSTLSKVKHVNLVRLFGICCSGPHRLLVYDFMPNGSLDRYLFDEGPDTALDWKTRYNIMLGVARGLAYLHEECTVQIVHCDVKPENILLDADFCPKVADFGMAKLIGRDFSRALTTMRGTRGYLAPEWINGLPITPKVDVYSYGMMLLELVSGKRNTSEFMIGEADVYRPLWVVSRVREGQSSDAVDPILQGDFHVEEVERACRVAGWCIQDHEDNRPSMRVIIQALEGVVDLNILPIPISLLQLAEAPKISKFYTECSSEMSNMYPS